MSEFHDANPAANMDVELAQDEGRATQERRKRSNNGPIDLSDEDENGASGSQRENAPIAVPPSPVVPPPPVDLHQLMLQSMRENRESFQSLRRDNEQIKHETKGARRIADKALIATEDTRKAVGALEARVSALEKRPQGDRGGKGGHSEDSPQTPTRDWDLLGGERGDTIVLSGFRQWASQEERKAEYERLKTVMPESLADKIVDTIVPRSPGSRVMIKIAQKPTVRETRAEMFAWCREFKTCNLVLKMDDESAPRTVTASPSKPFEVRKRDAQLLSVLSGLKLLAAEDQREQFIPDLANGRIFFNRRLLAERKQRDSAPEPNLAVISEVFPGTTSEMLKAKLDEAESLRKPQRGESDLQKIEIAPGKGARMRAKKGHFFGSAMG